MNISYYLHNETNANSFEKTVLWFKHNYNLISINELREFVYSGQDLRNSCMLSVDDGWRSTYDIIFPILKKHNIPFTIFVSPEITKTGKNFWYYTYQFCDETEIKNILIRRNYFSDEISGYPGDLCLKEIPIDCVYDVLAEYMTLHPEINVPRGFVNTQELLEMHKSGIVEIGAHTMLHPILGLEDYDRSNSEIRTSIEDLSEILNNQVSSFAYPNGLNDIDFGKREMNIVRTCGIDMAFSVNPGIITPETNPLSIPRWGSMSRLKFGRLGQFLPSRANQANIRKTIRKYKLL